MVFEGTAADIGKVFAAAGALGTAAYALVDATKAFRGGVSNMGFGFIRDATEAYMPALESVNQSEPLQTIRANWLNGVSKPEQKAVAKSLVRLGITTKTAASLADAGLGIDRDVFVKIAETIEAGEALTEQQVNVLGRFDAILEARIDAGFEQADQLYRNASRLVAAIVSVFLSVIGLSIVNKEFVGGADLALAIFVGVVAMPVAPIAKDITSAINTAVAAYKNVKGPLS